MDFFLALPLTKKGFNYALIITDKFSKRIIAILGKKI